MKSLIDLFKGYRVIVVLLIAVLADEVRAQTIDDIIAQGLELRFTVSPVVLKSKGGYNKVDSLGRKQGIWIYLTKGDEKWLVINNYRNGKVNGLEYQFRQKGNNPDISKNTYSLNMVLLYQDGVPKMQIFHESNGLIHDIDIMQRNKKFRFITEYENLPKLENCYQYYNYSFKNCVGLSSRGWNIAVDEEGDSPNDVVGKWVEYNEDGTVKIVDYGGYLEK